MESFPAAHFRDTGLFTVVTDKDPVAVAVDLAETAVASGQSHPRLRDVHVSDHGAAEAVRAAGLDVWVQVDGGITAETIGIAAEAGANTFVAGSAVFNGEVPAERIASLRDAVAAHPHRPATGHR